MSDARTARIDDAVSAAGEFLGGLLDRGPLNARQAAFVVCAAVRAAIPNAQPWEVRESAARIAEELEERGTRREQHNTTG